MNPYTPPEQGPDPETVQSGANDLARRRKRNRWIVIGAHFCLVLSVGLVASFLASSFIPNIKLAAPSPSPFGTRAEFAVGALVAMLVCPIIAGYRHWDVWNYLIASTLALSLLLGNAGSAFALSLFSLLILAFTKRLCFLLLYFKSSP